MDSDKHEPVYVTKQKSPERAFREEQEENDVQQRVLEIQGLMAQGMQENTLTRVQAYLQPTGINLAFKVLHSYISLTSSIIAIATCIWKAAYVVQVMSQLNFHRGQTFKLCCIQHTVDRKSEMMILQLC